MHTNMIANTHSTYLKRNTGTQLFAFILALAGSGTMVGGSLGLAEHYATNASGEQLMLAKQAAPQKLVRNACPDRAS